MKRILYLANDFSLWEFNKLNPKWRFFCYMSYKCQYFLIKTHEKGIWQMYPYMCPVDGNHLSCFWFLQRLHSRVIARKDKCNSWACDECGNGLVILIKISQFFRIIFIDYGLYTELAFVRVTLASDLTFLEEN